MSHQKEREFPWYHANMGRTQTESMLNGKPPGTWLVRDSSSIPGDYVLSVSESGKVSHYIINNKGSMYQIGEQTFPDLPAIIEFYKKHFLDTTTLKDHVPNNECSVKVKALYNFAGKDAEDLPFKRGDILTVISKEEDNWWRAMDSSGKKGMIPKPYVQLLQNPAPGPLAASPMQQLQSPNRPTQSWNADGRGSVDYTHPPMQQVQVPDDGYQYGVATMDRVVPYDKTQLTFQKGDIIKITSKKENGSWFGEKKNESGWFPFNYVREICREEQQHSQDRSFNGNF